MGLLTPKSQNLTSPVRPITPVLAPKALAVHYWGPKFQSGQIASKSKFYYSTNTFWFQIGQKCQNRTKIGDFSLINQWWIWPSQNSKNGYEVNVFCLWSDFNNLGQFGIRRYMLINRILILSQSDDLIFSVLSSERPKLWGQSGSERTGWHGRKLAFWGK